jgi:hypothetical protein
MPEENRESSIMTLIYNKINDMIGAGNQLFSMQFPAQPLNQNMYRYDTKDRNSVLTKPFTIAEAEFRLADQLFDVSPITAGSNGEKLSVVYSTAINNFIPKLDYLAPFIKDRAGLGHWLLENTEEKDEKGDFLSRIELCKKLYQEYLVAKNDWNEEKNKKFDELKLKEGGMDEYAKWQSSYGMVKSEELNNLYNDVIVSGHLHEVLTILGYLNASSIAEELEISKQKMRNSARLSLDESLTVYPVQLSPNNWFKALSPNLNPADLTMAKESVRDIYLDKQKELLRAKGDLQKAELMSTSPEDVKTAQAVVDTAKKAVADAESALIKQYGEGVVGVAKIYINTFGPGAAFNKAQAVKLGADPSQVYIDALKEAMAGISKTQDLQNNLTTAMGNWSTTMAKKSEVESKEWSLNKEALKQRVSELEVDVAYYADLLSGVTKEAGKQIRVEFIRKSFANKILTGDLEVSDSITGGSFTIKILKKDVKVTVPITNNKIDFAKIEADLNNSVSDQFSGSTVVAVNATDSPGFYTLSVATGQDGEPELSIDENELLPALDVKSPETLTKELTVDEAEIQGMFTDILLKITDSSDESATSASSQASASKWGVSLWFASASGSSSQSSGNATQKSEFFNQEMEIGFRVAKVSFDRGGWFNPNIFKMSHAFTRLADVPVAPGITVDNIKGKDQTALSALLKDTKGHSYILPAFPVAMAIAKDITIKVKKSHMNSATSKSVVESAKASSGGFLCFSVSSSSSSKNSSESAMHGSHGEYYYIRIPGPQVIGYFLQMVPEDKTEIYAPSTDSDGKNPIIDALKLYDNARELLQTSDTVLNNKTTPIT